MLIGITSMFSGERTPAKPAMETRKRAHVGLRMPKSWKSPFHSVDRKAKQMYLQPEDGLDVHVAQGFFLCYPYHKHNHAGKQP